MNKYFEKRLNEVSGKLERCRDLSRGTSYECITLMVVLELTNRVDEIESSMKQQLLMLYSKKEKYLEEQMRLLNMAQVLTSGLEKLIGHGEGTINTYGILKLIEAKNYKKAFEIISNLMELQYYNPAEDIERLLDLCKALDINKLHNLLINSWLDVNPSSENASKFKSVYMKYILKNLGAY